MDAVSPEADVEHYGAFIPLSRQAVVKHLTARAGEGEDAADFARLAVALHALRHRQYLDLGERVRACYLPFSPDRDTVRALPLGPNDRLARREELAGIVGRLLRRANYVALSEDDINRIITSNQPWSLRVSVDLSEYEHFGLHYRDVYEETHSFRRSDLFYLKRETVTIRSFRRLFLFLKLKPADTRAEELMREKGVSRKRAERMVERRRRFLPKGASSDFIYVKIFKDIPEYDVQILFPNRKVEFRPFDKVKFGVTAGGGTLFGIFSTTGKLAAATSPFAMAGAMAGFIGLIARQVKSFFSHRTKYMAELAQKLFFHNLANNRAALALMLDRAEEEEFKEDLFALAFLAGRTVDESELGTAKAAIERALARDYRVGVDFEIDDALARLEADGIVGRTAEGAVAVPAIPLAAERVHRKLDALDEWEIDRARTEADPADTAREETV